jgi:hypothetical protein
MGIAGEMLPTIARINNAILKADLIKRLSEKLSVDETSLREEMRKVKPDYGERKYVAEAREAKRDHKGAEIMLVALLFDGTHFVERVESELSLDEFRDTSLREIVKAIVELHKENKGINSVKLINYLGNSPDLAGLVSEAVSILEMVTDRERAFTDCVARIKQDNVKDRLGRLQEAIKSAHTQKDEDRVARLVKEYNTLVKPNKA